MQCYCMNRMRQQELHGWRHLQATLDCILRIDWRIGRGSVAVLLRHDRDIAQMAPVAYALYLPAAIGWLEGD